MCAMTFRKRLFAWRYGFRHSHTREDRPHVRYVIETASGPFPFARQPYAHRERGDFAADALLAVVCRHANLRGASAMWWRRPARVTLIFDGS